VFIASRIRSLEPCAGEEKIRQIKMPIEKKVCSCLAGENVLFMVYLSSKKEQGVSELADLPERFLFFAPQFHR
jgi:hypothetical protein